jgi:hypothetical protein
MYLVKMKYRVQTFSPEAGCFMNTNYQSDDLEELKHLACSDAFAGFRIRIVDETDATRFAPMSTDRKRQLYRISFLMAAAQIGCFFLMMGSADRTGVFSFRHLNWLWIASATVGLISATVAGGNTSKQSTSAAQVLALALNGAFLLWLWIVNMALYMRYD